MTKVLFGIDDTNPTFGQVGETSEWKLLDGLLASYPKLKITHFIPAQYSMPSGLAWGIQKRIRKTMGLGLGIKPNLHARLDVQTDWCATFQSYSQFEAGLHGLYHVNTHDGSAQEFVGLSPDETTQRVKESIHIFEKAGFPTPTIMAPPGWGITPELLRTLTEQTITIAGNFAPPLSASPAGWGTPSGLYPQRVRGLLNVPRNLSIETHDPAAIDKLLEKDAIIGLHGHFRNIGVRNGITSQTMENVRKILGQIESDRTIVFTFMGEVQ